MYKALAKPQENFEFLCMCPSGDGTHWEINLASAVAAKINNTGLVSQHIHLSMNMSHEEVKDYIYTEVAYLVRRKG